MIKSTLLDSPKEIRFTQSSTTTLKFQWNAPEGNTTQYIVTLFSDDNLLQRDETTQTSHEFDDLTEGRMYTIKIIALNPDLKLESAPLVKKVEIQTSQPSALDLKNYSPKVIRLHRNLFSKLFVAQYSLCLLEPAIGTSQRIFCKSYRYN